MNLATSVALSQKNVGAFDVLRNYMGKGSAKEDPRLHANDLYLC